MSINQFSFFPLVQSIHYSAEAIISCYQTLSRHNVNFLITTFQLCLLTHAVRSLLEAPYTKTSWRALLFRAILGTTGALKVCFDIWQFKQANDSETGVGGHHCDFEQRVPCSTVYVCMNSVKFVLEAPGASILWGVYYSVTMCRLTWGALLRGTLR